MLLDWRRIGLILLAIGYGAALAMKQLSPAALVPIALLAIAAHAVAPQRPRIWRYAGHGLFVVVGIALSLHALPGFHNSLVIDSVRFTPDAAPFTMYLNLDKPLVGIWLLLALPWVAPKQDWRMALKAASITLVATATTCFAIALLIGMVEWAPKWPASGWVWLANNLFLVTVTEEAFFRGYLQGGLSRLLARRTYGTAAAVCSASLLFGLAHAGGGWQWVLVASLAGVGYGWAYLRGGFTSAWLAHVGLNTLHFCLFTYPMLAHPPS